MRIKESGNLGKFTYALIGVAAVSAFALPTVTSAYQGQYTFLTIVIMLLAIIALLISAIMQETNR